MKLIFNAESLRPPITGVGYYSLNLLEQALAGADFDAVYCFTGTGWQPGAAQLSAVRARLHGGTVADASMAVRSVQSIRRALGLIPGVKPLYAHLMARRFTRFAESVGDAVYHETNYILKPFSGPCVTTIHDLSHLRFPHYHPADSVAHLNRSMPDTLRRANAIITDSELVKDEILRTFDLPESRVFAIYPGVDPRYHPRTAEQTCEVLDLYGLRYQRYVLLASTLEPRKGIDTLLTAWEHLAAELRSEFPLILVGSPGWNNQQLRERIGRLGESGGVRHLGYVPDTHLPALFSAATVFAYPSVYEGFGLPVLDAMSSGVPVVCRAGTAMAEFSAGACLLCDSGDPGELAARLAMLLASGEERLKWRARGLERAKAFSWERCARETTAVYRLVS